MSVEYKTHCDVKECEHQTEEYGVFKIFEYSTNDNMNRHRKDLCPFHTDQIEQIMKDLFDPIQSD